MTPRSFVAARGLHRGLEHRAAAAGMHGDQAGAELGDERAAARATVSGMSWSLRSSITDSPRAV